MTAVLLSIVLSVSVVFSIKVFFPHWFNEFVGGKPTRERDYIDSPELEYRDVLDSLPAGLFVIDENHTITYANKSLVDYLGTTKNSLLNRSLSKVFEISEGLRHQLDATRTAPGEQTLNRSEVTYVHPDGNKNELQLVFTAVTRNDSPRFICLVPTFTNIIAARENLRKTERLKAMGEMVSGLAHEINNPLTGVVGFTNLLLEGDENSAHREELQIIHENAQRCKDIIDNLLGFIRSGTPETETIDVNKIIENSIKLTRRELDIHDIQITQDLDPELPPVEANRTQIEEVFINLLTNARDELKNRDKNNRMIRVVTKPMGQNTISIAVDDNGSGIPADEKNTIFEPFYTTKTGDAGTGLGLSIAQSIVNDLGGDISVDGSDLGGASFKIVLPTTDSDQAELEARSTERSRRTHLPDRIQQLMIVEDEKSVVQLFERFCDQYGLDCLYFENPLGAINHLNEQEDSYAPDAIFLDLVYPGQLRGRDFYEWLQAFQPDLVDRLVFITGNPNDEQVDIARSSDSIALLSKPLTIPEIGETLNQKSAYLSAKSS